MMQLTNLLKGLHEYDNLIHKGWNVYSPYISMAYSISIPSLLVINLFPSKLAATSFGSFVAYLLMLTACAWMGKHRPRLGATLETEEVTKP